MAKTKIEIIQLIEAVGYTKASSVLKPNKDQIIDDFWLNKTPPTKWSEVLYCLVNGCPPQCRNGHHMKFIDCTKGYMKYTCLGGCDYLSDLRMEDKPKLSDEKKQTTASKREATMLARYGVSNIFNSPKCQSHIKKTILEKYGVENVSQSLQLQSLKKKNNLEKWGHIHPMSSPDLQEKRKATLVERYGVDCTFLSKEIKEKCDQTNLERYGVKNVFESDTFQKKASNRIFELYGANNSGSIHLSKETKDVIYDPLKFGEFISGKSIAKAAADLGDISETQIAAIAKKFNVFEKFKLGQGSVYQDQIEEWLINQNITVVRNNRTIIKPLEIDLYLPQYKFGIEMNGLFYHTELTGNKDKNYHAHKQNRAQEANVELMQVYSDEWIKKPNLIKELILRRLGISNPIKIHGRVTSVKEISWNETDQFLNNYHLQGSGAPTKHNYGLFLSDELLAVMTFAQGRKALNSSQWELVRFAQKSYYSIIGGMSKLFKCAQNKLQFNEIASYCNIRLFSGDSYSKLNFLLDKVTGPGYEYTNYQNRFHRYNFTKHSLIEQGYDSSKTEWEIMQERGYDRIWDCGHAKWIWRK